MPLQSPGMRRNSAILMDENIGLFPGWTVAAFFRVPTADNYYSGNNAL